ncbi:MAG: hypothetical protein KY468_04760 [Armatimonadetes bacterium]|nr:hypothetical protein [Armatimonadota bacterium]
MAPEEWFRVLHGAVSGQKDGKPCDFFMGAVVPESCLSPVHDVDSLIEAGVIEPSE